MKYLLVLLVVVIGIWLLLGKSRGRSAGGGQADARRKQGGDGANVMVRCSHCGVHLPAADAVSGDGARLYCSEAHRLAGPR